ncbi:MAG: hypothetical protein ACJATI_004228 [Halioglobus sp.]|jgi:hypothetical protein
MHTSQTSIIFQRYPIVYLGLSLNYVLLSPQKPL